MKKLFINNNILKIIGLISMTISHIGLFLSLSSNSLGTILECIGSISFPIFILLNIEGNKHTSSHKKYTLRLLISSLFIFLIITIFSFINISIEIFKYGNIFIDLFLFNLIYYFLFINKNNYKYIYLSLIGIFYVLTYLIKVNILNINISIYKSIGGLFPQYSLFGLFIYLSSLISFYIYDKRVKNIDPEFINSNKYKLSLNVIYCIILAIYSLIAYAFTYSFNDYSGINPVTETYIILSGIFIIFYNYEKPITSKIFKYSCYIYYPLHLLILYLIFYL